MVLKKMLYWTAQEIDLQKKIKPQYSSVVKHVKVDLKEVHEHEKLIPLWLLLYTGLIIVPTWEADVRTVSELLVRLCGQHMQFD